MALDYDGILSLTLHKYIYMCVMRKLWSLNLFIIRIECSLRGLLFLFERFLLHRNECY